MFVLNNVRKKEIADQIISKKMELSDFDFLEANEEDEISNTIVNKATGFYFRISYFEPDDYQSRFVIGMTPGEFSIEETRLDMNAWPQVLSTLSTWTNRVQAEVNTPDPWSDDNKTFTDPESKFNPDEYEAVERGVDAAVSELVSVAARNGVQVDMVSLQEDISGIKKDVRKLTRRKWLEQFQGYVIGKLADWGLSALLASSVLKHFMTTQNPLSGSLLQLKSYRASIRDIKTGPTIDDLVVACQRLNL